MTVPELLARPCRCYQSCAGRRVLQYLRREPSHVPIGLGTWPDEADDAPGTLEAEGQPGTPSDITGHIEID